MIETHDDDVDPKALADEIEQRKLKFADVRDDWYEMLSGDELEVLLAALRAYEIPKDGALRHPPSNDPAG